jgi:hypothetical protein
MSCAGFPSKPLEFVMVTPSRHDAVSHLPPD